MPNCLIGLGSNLEPRQATLQRALARLTEHPDVTVTAQSRWHETRPAGGPPDQPRYLNAAAVLQTSLSPQQVLDLLLLVEDELGRRRDQRWGPRTVDLDLLLYERQVLHSARLEIPHPRMVWRRFVLEPSVEIAGQWVHPTIGWSLARLLEHLSATPPYLALAGAAAAGKTELARQLADRLIATAIVDEPGASLPIQPGTAWQMEIELLRQRARQLDASRPLWRARRPVVSDFWFDQSPCFADMRLEAHQRAEFRRCWQEARAAVVRPRLIVLLTWPPELLHERLHTRGRIEHCEWRLDQLAEIQRSIEAQAVAPDQGPVLRLSDLPPREMFEEVAAAVTAME